MAIFYTIVVIILVATSDGDDRFISTQYLRSAVGQAVLVTCVVAAASQLVSLGSRVLWPYADCLGCVLWYRWAGRAGWLRHALLHLGVYSV